MNKRGLIGLLVVAGALVVVGFFWFAGEWNSDEAGVNLSEARGECVASTCCHATECVWENEAPNCDGALCTMDCEPATMDCGQGRCEVVDGECGVVWNE